MCVCVCVCVCACVRVRALACVCIVVGERKKSARDCGFCPWSHALVY